MHVVMMDIYIYDCHFVVTYVMYVVVTLVGLYSITVAVCHGFVVSCVVSCIAACVSVGWWGASGRYDMLCHVLRQSYCSVCDSGGQAVDMICCVGYNMLDCRLTVVLGKMWMCFCQLSGRQTTLF